MHCDNKKITDGQYDKSLAAANRKKGKFARTGVPAPNWPLYDLKDKQVMVLDEFDIHPAKEADVKIVDWERAWFLTKYYML